MIRWSCYSEKAVPPKLSCQKKRLILTQKCLRKKRKKEKQKTKNCSYY